MEWRDKGLLLKRSAHGEHAAIIEVFTSERGKYAGLVHGGASRKMAPVLQPGALLDITWKARLEDHLGAYSVELETSRMAVVLNDRMALAGLNAVSSLLLFCLPERQGYPGLYAQTCALLEILGQSDIWPLAYMQWEMALLEHLGYGLDLDSCAVLGPGAGVPGFISPRTGRAVSREGAGKWANRLLPLPPCMIGLGEAPDTEVAASLKVTGHFLRSHFAGARGDKPLPEARQRFVNLFMAGSGV
ncbi:MAG: DNA repair protein RecO [Roseovarius sp.]|nr:DNA repair protein RecO [Roseovarius sp.]MCY4207588.1 DNA repair protein RecO [Roseovarius sp.]MCY4291792.1 DNA repair protein RecO [Roseovarius sp.]MCY4316784.1 DNA repair protein RecO [Roseovarius sp.]